jgi:ABC-type nitrate/sulfonate/bicarbonate transport system ATPase subunit
MSAPIVVNGVRKTFRSAAEPVIERLDLAVGAGEFVSLLGPSGCGKTTLLRMMDGLTTPDEGTITIGTQTITAPTPSVGFVFQADSLWPWRTVLENVTFGLEMLGRDRRAHSTSPGRRRHGAMRRSRMSSASVHATPATARIETATNIRRAFICSDAAHAK